MDDQTSSPAAEPGSVTTPGRPRRRRPARAGEQRPRAKSPRRHGGRPLPRLSDGISMFYLMSYCHQLEMILDRLDQDVPLDDEAWTEAQRQHCSREGVWIP